MGTDNVELIRRGYQAFVDGDLEAISSLLAPDVEWRSVDYGPWDAHDRETVLDVLVERLQEGYRVELEECVAAGDRVVVGFRAAGMEQPRRIADDDGRTFGVSKYFTISRYFAVVTIRDGRVVKVEDFPGREDALAAAGVEA
jgi:ketosteroid isomerase-like protein